MAYSGFTHAPIPSAPPMTSVLEKFGLSTHKTRIAVVLDISSSMEGDNDFYRTGKVQRLVERALSIAEHMSVTQGVDIFLFGAKCHGPFQVPASNREIGKFISMYVRYPHNQDGIYPLEKSTNFAAPIEALTNYYFPNSHPNELKPKPASTAVYAIVVTDGDCNDQYKEAALKASQQASYYPIFTKYLAFAGRSKVEFHFLKNDLCQGKVKCDDDSDSDSDSDEDDHIQHAERFVDNADLQCLKDPNELTDEMLLAQYPQYLSQIYHEPETQLLTQDPGVPYMSHDEQHKAGRRYDDHENHGEHGQHHEAYQAGSKTKKKQSTNTPGLGMFAPPSTQSQPLLPQAQSTQRKNECCRCAIL